MFGYTGKILEVDLTHASTRTIELAPEIYRNYIGGSGIAAKLIFDELGSQITKIDPLGAENPLVFMTGPLSGTILPSTARMTVNAISPLTGFWGEANVGGYMSKEIKACGYDGLIVKGAAKEPVYLLLEDDRVEILPASELWGKNTYEASDLLVEKHRTGNKTPHTLMIGPASENGVLYGAIIHDKAHVFGRTGMGTVMGAKKLKAIVVRGNIKTELADESLLKEVRTRILEKAKESIAVDVLSALGTHGAFEFGYDSGDVPIKNWSMGRWDEGAELIGGVAFSESVVVGHKTCYACPVSCKPIAEVKEGPYQMEKGAGAEYETICCFGTMLLVDDKEFLSKINEVCNQIGVDSITAGSTIAVAVEAFENGYLTLEDTGGIELKWSDPQTYWKLLLLIGSGEGFGKRLGLGSAKMAATLNPAVLGYITTVKGLEAPMHDPRFGKGLGLAYATGYRGACHVSDLTMSLEAGSMFLDKIGLSEELDPRTSEGKAEVVAKSQDFSVVFGNCAVLCDLGGMIYTEDDVMDALQATTGLERTIEDIMQTGQRIWNLKRVISNLRGMTAAEDKLPQRLMTPLADGPTAGEAPDMNLMIKEYYEIRNLDQSTGRPSQEKLKNLGLANVAEVLYN